MKKYILFLILALTPSQASLAFRANLGFWQASASGSCGGTLSNGACWYLSNVNESCSTLCAAHGGYSSATETYAAANTINCQVITLALGQGNVITTVTENGLGCVVQGGWGLLDTASFSSTAAHASYQRACACNN